MFKSFRCLCLRALWHKLEAREPRGHQKRLHLFREPEEVAGSPRCAPSLAALDSGGQLRVEQHLGRLSVVCAVGGGEDLACDFVTSPYMLDSSAANPVWTQTQLNWQHRLRNS